MFEPVHGSAPDIAGTGKANPLGAILTAAMVLRHSANLEQDALAVEQAVHQVLDAGYRTGDIARGNHPNLQLVSTQEMGKRVHQALVESIDRRQSMHAV
jgi:3-isopropylmalate dehydrogenase